MVRHKKRTGNTDWCDARMCCAFYRSRGEKNWQNDSGTPQHTSQPHLKLSPRTKKIQKNVPARARYIIRILSAPRNNVVTIQRVSCHPGTPRMLEY